MTIMTAHYVHAISRRDAVRVLALASLSIGVLVAASPIEASAGTGISDAVDQKDLAEMTQDLAKFVPEHFEPLIGDVFKIGEYQVTLRDVYRRAKTASRFREQFALIFALPHEVPITSELLPVAHPKMGQHDLLVTQIIDGTGGTALEICFS
jgi:hypothetical protein